MKKYFFVVIAIVSFYLSSCNQKQAVFVNNIIPAPAQVDIKEGSLKIETNIHLVLDTTCADSKKLYNYVSYYLSNCFNTSLSNTYKTGNDTANIAFTLTNDSILESYVLNIDKKGITISSPSYKGMFLGFQTLRQVFPVGIENGHTSYVIYLPFLTITDYPRFAYRGMHLDVSRHFFSVEDVKTYIDMLVLHKFNTLHLHLTDDQGWRIEIKSLPLLTEIGSIRKETVIKKNTGVYDSTPYSGFYTQSDIQEIVKYAEDRFINVIPEIEMPGHALAALTSYPELGCRKSNYEVAKMWGVFDDVYCAGSDSTFAFLEKVIDEVCLLFPNSEYIHIGGDECPKDMWKTCKACQKRMKDNKLLNEHELQSYFVQRIERYINSKGKRIIGWDEILEGGLAPNATVMSWRGETGGIAAAKQNHDVIMTPTDYCYFDYYQSENQENEPFAICCFINSEKIYNWEPVPSDLTISESKHILGVQANVWTEYIKDITHLQYMTLPRMAAMSEVAWVQPETKNYSNFKTRLQSLFKRYEILSYNFAKHEMITDSITTNQ